MIYLDNNATTAVHPEVLEAMLPFLTKQFHNPSSGYRAGKAVRRAIQTAREQVAELIAAKENEIVFTSCGTESNNTALKWMARFVGRKTSRVVTSTIEHSSVLRPCEAFTRAGFDVINCRVSSGGRLNLDEFRAALDCEKQGFASIMWANNETGIIQPVPEACTIAKEFGWAFHTDAIQAVGKTPIDVQTVPVDFLSISGHKFHAPKGVGALFIREGIRFEPLLRGGGQESDRRSGTENVASIVGLGKAAQLMQKATHTGHLEKITHMRDQFETIIFSELEGVQRNGDTDFRTFNISHLSFDNCEAAGLLILLDEYGVQCSAGSACMTGKQQPSHVQKAMGISDTHANSSLRFSWSALSKSEEVEPAAAALIKAVKKLRQVQSPNNLGPVQIYPKTSPE